MEEPNQNQAILPMTVPRFKSDIPRHLTEGLSETEQWLYEQISIQGQQNKWLIEQAVRADLKQRRTDRDLGLLEGRIQVFEGLKTVLGAKWSIVMVLVTLVVVPAAMALLGAWAYAYFEKIMLAKGT